MKKEDYFGKYILREGDLRPEEVNEQSCSRYDLTMEVLAYFKSIGLLFDNKQEALAHWKCIMGAMKKPVDKRESILVEENKGLKVYFNIDESTIEGVEQWLVDFKRYDEADVKKAIESCKKEPIKIPVIREGLESIMRSHFAAALLTIQNRLFELFPNKYNSFL